MNPHDNGLRRSPRLLEKWEKEKETSQKRKAHVSFGTADATKLGFGLFSLIALATNVVVPQHQTEMEATFTQQLMNRFHEVNEMYEGTLNEVHHLLYATNISSNESFTFRNAMKQDDKLAFVDAVENEISDHEKGCHWLIFHRDTLPNKARPIKEIWSFKQKRKPDGELLKHKASLCAHGGMQQWGNSYWETYSPVVNMLSVRLILAISKLHNLDMYGGCNKIRFWSVLAKCISDQRSCASNQTKKDATFTQQLMNRFHEVNEMYDGTLNEVHHLLYATDISSNDNCTFLNAMKQDYKVAFVEAM